MKTNQFKTAAFVMAALFCLAVYPASAHKHSKHYYRSFKRHYTKKTVAKTALADMKIKNVNFGFNKAEVPESAHETLDNVAKLMGDNKASLKLGGYADSKGGYVYNWKLSKVRADAVKAYLVSKGADSSRIAATEFGYTHPIASNKTPQGRMKNRRVEIKFAE